MISHRKGFGFNIDGDRVMGYHTIAKDADGKVTAIFTSHIRADEYRHANFIEAHRDPRNKKPYRSKALKLLARDNARRVDGRFVSDTGVLHHV